MVMDSFWCQRVVDKDFNCALMDILPASRKRAAGRASQAIFLQGTNLGEILQLENSFHHLVVGIQIEFNTSWKKWDDVDVLRAIHQIMLSHGMFSLPEVLRFAACTFGTMLHEFCLTGLPITREHRSDAFERHRTDRELNYNGVKVWKESAIDFGAGYLIVDNLVYPFRTSVYTDFIPPDTTCEELQTMDSIQSSTTAAVMNCMPSLTVYQAIVTARRFFSSTGRLIPAGTTRNGINSYTGRPYQHNLQADVHQSPLFPGANRYGVVLKDGIVFLSRDCSAHEKIMLTSIDVHSNVNESEAIIDEAATAKVFLMEKYSDILMKALTLTSSLIL